MSAVAIAELEVEPLIERIADGAYLRDLSNDPTLWSPLFVQALSWLLAIDLCSALPKKLEWTDRVKAGFREAYAAAGAHTIMASAIGDDPAGVLEGLFAPAVERMRSIETKV